MVVCVRVLLWTCTLLTHVVWSCSHLKVDLSEENSKGSYFRIMPRFKVRTEGERIRLNDQVPTACMLVYCDCRCDGFVLPCAGCA
jgi:hypothetical protein